MNRRSFLAAVLGAAVAPVAAKLSPSRQSLALERFSAAWAELRDQCIVRPFIVYDSAVITPGEIIRERLLPPPAPVNFIIEQIGVFVSAETRATPLSAAAQGLRLEITDGKLTWYDGPLYHIAFDSFSRLPIPLTFQQPQESGIYLHSAGLPVENSEPVTISLVFSGLARV